MNPMPMIASLASARNEQSRKSAHRMKKIADSRLDVSSALGECDYTHSIRKTTTSSVPTILKPSKTVSCS